MARVKMTEERMKEMGITIDDVKEYRRQRRNLRRCTRDVGSKYKNIVSNWYDDLEATAKWKRGIQKKEARKVQHEAKNKGDATMSQKRKEPPQVDPNSAAPPKNKKQKAEEVKQGKKKVVVSESSSSDDKGWKPTPSANQSSDTENNKDDNVPVDKTRARLYKKLKRKQRENVAPEVKADYNKTKLEDYDIRLVGRSLCKMSTIKMDSFEDDYPFGIDELLRPFRGLLELTLPYSESVVKVFYSHLKMSRRGVVSTCVRGQIVEVNEKKLMEWLSVKAPQAKDTTFTGDEMDKILLEGGTTEDDLPLHRPKQLPYKYRVLHYLYSRNFVNKGKHYTTLSLDDKQILCCLIRKKPFNLGKRIVDTMLKAAAVGQKNIELPYPSLVSLILDKNKIWYLHEDEPPIWSQEFNEEALHRMQIPVPDKESSTKTEAEGEKIPKTKRQAPPPPSAPHGSSPGIGDVGPELAAMFGKVLNDALGVLKAELEAVIETQVSRLDSRLSHLALEFRGLEEFIHLYGAEYREFASFKATQGDGAGPSTKPGHASGKGSAEASHNSPTTNLGGQQHISDNDEEEQKDFDGDGNGSEGETDATLQEEENSAGASGSEGETDTKEEEEQDSGGASGSDGHTDGEEQEDEVSGGASESDGHTDGEEEEEEEVSGGGSRSDGQTDGEEQEEEVHGGVGTEGDTGAKEEEEEVHGGGSRSEGDTGAKEEEEDAVGGGTGTEGDTHEEEMDSHTGSGNKGTENETQDEGMDDNAGGRVKGSKSQTSDDKTSEQEHVDHDNVNEGPTTEKKKLKKSMLVVTMQMKVLRNWTQ